MSYPNWKLGWLSFVECLAHCFFIVVLFWFFLKKIQGEKKNIKEFEPQLNQAINDVKSKLGSGAVKTRSALARRAGESWRARSRFSGFSVVDVRARARTVRSTRRVDN